MATKKSAGIRKKQVLEPGKCYKGSAFLNEYGQVEFTAYQRQEEGANAMRKVFEDVGENYKFAFYQSDENCKMSIVVPRGDARVVERRLRETFIKLLLKMYTYDI